MSAIRGALALLIVCCGLCSAPACFAQDLPEGRLMRFPDIYKDQIVFSYGGDLWLTTATGGVARRITSHPGLELFPKFSPDGKWIAFTGQYDGNFNVYVMPAAGGEPRQLTFLPDIQLMPERMGPNNEVITWTPDSQRIVFLSRRNTFNDWFGRLFTVSVQGGLAEQLPVDKGGLTSFSPDGTKMVYNRIFANFRGWKRYTGGLAPSLSIYDLKSNQIENISPYEGTSTYPLWHGDTIYFGSDRGPDHRINLFAYDLNSRQTRQLTHYTDYDVGWPSLNGNSLVFENGGYLYLFDLATEQAHKLTISLPGDREWTRRRWDNVSKLITDFDISPDGNRAVFSARGDVFTVPAKHGSIRDLTQSPGVREHSVSWSPDGKWIAYVSDRTGEEELCILPQDGIGKEVAITAGSKGFYLATVWSPDSKKLLYADQKLRLWYVDVAAKKPVQVDQAQFGEIINYTWSPDSLWVAYSKPDENTNQFVELYSLPAARITHVTTSFYNSYYPQFDPDGKYLFFLSNRDYNEVLGVYDSEFSNPKATRVYAVTLRADLPSPFAPQSDEVGQKSEPAAQEKTEPPPSGSADTKTNPDVKNLPKTPPKAVVRAPKAKTEATPAPPEKTPPETPGTPLRIDLEGIDARIVAFPIPIANISHLAAAKDLVVYGTLPVTGLSGPVPGEDPAVHVFDMKERQDHVLVSPADNFAVSFDGKKLLYSTAGDDGTHRYGILDTTAPAAPHKPPDGDIALDQLRMEIDPPAEWSQMFHEAWRQQRDYFYESAMNGVDWDAVQAKYAVLLPYVADRYDLTYLLTEMIGELANSHTYTGAGDYPDLKPVNVGMLGVDFSVDTDHGLYRIAKIYPGEDWDSRRVSPLTEPGVQVAPGSYLLAVNGHPLRVPQDPYELFLNTSGQTVTLTVNDAPTEQGARNVVARTIASEYHLRELDWIETNRRKVDLASNGRVGYIYIPNMEDDGLNEFVRQFFPQIRKQGLIFDVRFNGGGFVDQIIFERLRRVLAGMQSARNWTSGTIPDAVFNGYMDAISNEYSASDGDFFTYFFKFYKLGPVVGMRTWGGVRGIRGYTPLVDGGYVTRPEFSLYGLNSQWLIENHGVEPDVVVDNRPDLVRAGRDPQLEKALELLVQDIEQHPKPLPPRPSDLPAYPGGPGS